MLIKVVRFSNSEEFGGSTLGILLVDGVFECFTLEDEFRKTKEKHETRISNGLYDIKIRMFGGHHEKYSKRFKKFHKGMLEIANVPNFTDILIHIGNHEAHTSGCLLVGDAVNNNKIQRGFLSSSSQAYIRLYKKVVNSAIAGDLEIQFSSL